MRPASSWYEPVSEVKPPREMALELGLVAQHRIVDVFGDLLERFGLVVVGVDVDDQEVFVVPRRSPGRRRCAAACGCRTRWRQVAEVRICSFMTLSSGYLPARFHDRHIHFAAAFHHVVFLRASRLLKTLSPVRRDGTHSRARGRRCACRSYRRFGRDSRRPCRSDRLPAACAAPRRPARPDAGTDCDRRNIFRRDG